MTWTLTSSGAAVAKAGAGVLADAVNSGTLMTRWSDEAEDKIVGETRRNWVSDYSNVPAGLSGALSNVASSLIALQLIAHDTSGYTSLAEAQTMMDLQDNIVAIGMKSFKDFKTTKIWDLGD